MSNTSDGHGLRGDRRKEIQEARSAVAAPGSVLSFADAARLRTALAQKLASFGYCASRSAVEAVAGAVEAIVEPLVSRHVAAERERRERDECSPTCAPHLQQFCSPLCEAEARAERAEAEVDRLAEEKAAAYHESACSYRRERDALRAAVAEAVEVATQRSYAQIAADKMLTILPIGDDRAAVPGHWRERAEADASVPVADLRALLDGQDGETGE